MKIRYACMILAGEWGLAMSAPADVVWSGDMYQRTYLDIPAIDFNLDGTNDFSFRQEAYGFFYWDYFIVPTAGQIVVNDHFAFDPPAGEAIAVGEAIAANLNNPDIKWEASETILFSYSEPHTGEYSYGGFFVQNVGYLGVSFEVDGATHYGWIKLSHDETRPKPENQFLYINGWAWETEADTPIIAGAIPEPSTGILTMAGSLALIQLARHRRRR